MNASKSPPLPARVRPLITIDLDPSQFVDPGHVAPIVVRHSHYKKDVRHLAMIDPYRVCKLWEQNDPALQHALKKILLAGMRGAKDWRKDVQEAIDSCQRSLDMDAEDRAAS